jgi:GGDEF domain-containing protein
MSEDHFSRRRRPRPVAELPPAGSGDGRELAKGWLLELFTGAALSEAGAVPAAVVAQDGPALCAALLAALGDDAALTRLSPGGDLAPLAAGAAHMTGAVDAPGALAAAEALRRAAWELLQPAVADGSPALVGDAAARLAHVCAVVSAAAVHAVSTGAGPAAPQAPGPAGPAPAPASGVPQAPAPVSASGVPRPPAPVSASGVPRPPAPVSDASPAPSPAQQPVSGGFAVRDLRAVAGGDPVSAAIRQRASANRPFAVLALEVDDLQRLVASQRGREVAFALEAVDEAIRGQLDPADTFVREHAGRSWVLTGAAARALGDRIGDAIARTAPVQGAPLTVSLGLASFPDDGEGAEDLIARADEGLFAARAAGVRLA